MRPIFIASQRGRVWEWFYWASKPDRSWEYCGAWPGLRGTSHGDQALRLLERL